MRMIKTQDATVDQVRRFAEISGIENVANLDLESLVEAMALAGVSTEHIYVEDPRPELDGADLNPDHRKLTKDNERWCECNIAPDPNAEHTLSPVFLSVGGSFAHVKRGVRVVIRERLYRRLVESVEYRTTQKIDENSPMTKFADGVRQGVPLYPHQFLGYKGLVRDGNPEVGENSIVYTA